MASSAFERLGSILKSRKLSLNTKIRVLNCYVLPILTYGCECWTITKELQKRIEATEMWFLRRMLRISWTEHITNEEVLRRTGSGRRLMKMIRKRQMEFLGHVMRKDGLENLMVTGKIEGRRSRGRQRKTYIRSLSEWTKKSQIELLRATRHRQRWRSMIADVLPGYGT